MVGSLARIDLDKAENLIPVKKVDVGFAVKAMLENLEKDSKITQLQLLGFFTECQRFLKTTTAKLLERCPLKYPIVRNLTALDPRHIVSHPQSASRRLGKCWRNWWLARDWLVHSVMLQRSSLEHLFHRSRCITKKKVHHFPLIRGWTHFITAWSERMRKLVCCGRLWKWWCCYPMVRLISTVGFRSILKLYVTTWMRAQSLHTGELMTVCETWNVRYTKYPSALRWWRLAGIRGRDMVWPWKHLVYGWQR